MNYKPKVSIVTITYNQEKYIRQALDSFLEQKTDFNFEVIVADDCSTDNTAKIIKEYSDKHPKIFKPILRKKNIGAVPNFLGALRSATGEFIALCEGDDYWTDPGKLRQQVEFLNKHPEYALCFHPVKVFFENNEEPEQILPKENGPDKFIVEKLIESNFIYTNSVMYRKQLYKNMPTDVIPYDWFLHLYHAQFGKIGFINKVMSAYRRHPGGMWWDVYHDSDKIWLKYGLSHLALYREMLAIHKDTPHTQEIIYKKINMALDKLYNIDKNNSFLEALKKYPEYSSVYIAELNKKIALSANELESSRKETSAQKRDIENLRNSVKELENNLSRKDAELLSIYSSRLWKVLLVLRQIKNWFIPTRK